MKLLDLYCGRFGWSRAFAARGWECVGMDLVEPPEIPAGCTFERRDILTLTAEEIIDRGFDFICASSPCEEFSVFGMKHFHPNPKHPEMGLKLFNHTRDICEKSGLPYVMENVRAAQQFVGKAVHHCGPFYLWGNAIPVLMPQNIKKGLHLGSSKWTREQNWLHAKVNRTHAAFNSKSKERKELTAKAAEIPPELSACVADYAERILSSEPGELGIKEGRA